MFYDCEEGEKIQLKVSKLARSFGNHLPGFHEESDDAEDNEESESNSPKIPQWILMQGFAKGCGDCHLFLLVFWNVVWIVSHDF